MSRTPDTEAPVRFTVFRSNHALSKTLTRLPDLTVHKDGSTCALGRGTFTTLSATGLREFAAMLMQAKRTECFGYGTCVRTESGTVVSEARAKDGDITRTKKHWRYEPGTPGVMMLDYDARPNGQALDRDGWLELLEAVCPALAATARLWRPSTSSLISDHSGKELIGVAGQRLYLEASDASGIPRAGKALFERLWLAGHGHIEISKAGIPLVRAPVDASVFSPERLDFVAGAVCKDGLKQGDLTPEYMEGEALLDTRTAMPDLTEDEKAEYQRLVEASKDAIRPEAEKVREAYVEAKSEEIAQARGIPRDEARRIVEAAVSEKATLYGDFLLKFDRYGVVSVGDVPSVSLCS